MERTTINGWIDQIIDDIGNNPMFSTQQAQTVAEELGTLDRNIQMLVESEPARPTWISVEECLPEIGQTVQVTGVAEGGILEKPYRGKWETIRKECGNDTDGLGFLRIVPYSQFVITHWCHLPVFRDKQTTYNTYDKLNGTGL